MIDPATLPNGLVRALQAAENLTGAAVSLLDITTDLEVPAYLAYTPPASAAGAHNRGAGASLDATHAAWRALTELVQSTLVVGRSPAPPVLDGLAAHPQLHACGRFDLADHLPRAQTVAFPGSPAASPLPHDPAQHLPRLVHQLLSAGYQPYYRVVAELKGGVTAVHTIVPGLERFMLITEGNLVLPGIRARTALTGRQPLHPTLRA